MPLHRLLLILSIFAYTFVIGFILAYVVTVSS